MSRLWLSLCLIPAALQAAEYSHKIWRTEDGLPQNRVQAIAQTSEGYLWVGTSEGLARFDGSRFLVFDRSNTPAITDNSVVSLESVSDGSLWIGTEGGGLVHYAHAAFQSFGAKEGLTNNFVRATHLDAAGTLWVGTDRGFFRYRNNSFERLDNTAAVPLATVIGLAEDESHQIWVATSAGLFRIENDKLTRASCTPASAYYIVSLIREKLIRDGCSAPPAAIPALPVTVIRKDTSGNLWIGSIGRGLISLNLTSGATTTYSAPSVLPDNTVLQLFEDRQHNIWAGAQDGLVRLSQSAVTTVSLHDGLGDDNISTTYEDRAGDLWLITFSGQIYRLKDGKPERYYLPPPAREFRTRTVVEGIHGDYWFGTSGAGAVHLAGGKAVVYTRKDGLRSDSIRQILEDSRGNVWFATGSGLSQWNGRAFTNYYLEQGLSYPSVRCLAETPDGDILAGTDSGLNRIHEGRIVNDPSFSPLRQEKIWSLHVDGKNLWLGTRGGGLVLIRNRKTTRFTTREGLVNNSIYQIIDDHAGRFWMSSPVGVSSVRRQELLAVAAGDTGSLHAAAYGSADGMATSQMYGGIQPAGVRRASGEIWFPSVRGAVRFDPAHMPERRAGPVLIESVSAGDDVLPMANEIVIAPGRGRLQIDFAACDLASPQQVSYRYKLEGSDDAWTAPSRVRSAYYSNLPPGHYRFRVRAEDASATAESEASVAIYQKPAFHQTFAFYTLLAGLLGCCIWAGLSLYARQTKTRFALLLNERTRLAREMHDTVIQGCVGVSTLLEAIARFQRTNMEEATQLLAHARSQIKVTLEEARQAVWDLRRSDGEQSFILGLFDLARKLGAEHGATVDTQIEGNRLPLDPVTDRMLLLVGREALRNSVAHGNPARISVRIAFENTGVSMEVSDDGKGFDAARTALEPNGHFGIVGMRERVEQLGGTFDLHSRPGQGTSVSVSLPANQKTTMPR